jgi:hypothetical protein
MKTVALLLSLSLFTVSESRHTTRNPDVIEAINDLEDMQEWIYWDIQEGYTDSLRGHLLIDNLNMTIERLEQIK